MKPLVRRSQYMTGAWDWDKTGRKAKRAFADVDYDTLVGTGLSGALIVPYLARRLKKHALIVRKPDDGSHSWYPVEGVLGARWVFVDDFVETGRTRQRVHQTIEQIERARPSDPPSTYVGQYLYVSNTFTPAETES